VDISALGGYAARTIFPAALQSLLTTAAGLGWRSRAGGIQYLPPVNTMMHDIERGGIEAVHMIYERHTRRRKAGRRARKASRFDFKKA